MFVLAEVHWKSRAKAFKFIMLRIFTAFLWSYKKYHTHFFSGTTKKTPMTHFSHLHNEHFTMHSLRFRGSVLFYFRYSVALLLCSLFPFFCHCFMCDSYIIEVLSADMVSGQGQLFSSRLSSPFLFLLFFSEEKEDTFFLS